MADRERAEELRQQILDLVGEYTKVAHAPAPFVPGESKVPYAGRVFDAHEITNLVDSSLEFWLTAGPWGARLEKAMRRFFGAPDFLLVNSGSSANLTMVSTLCSPMVERRLEPGDEVITPAVTFPTTLTPIVQNGLIPVFVDCELGTYNVDPARVEAAIGPRTRAMVIPHTLGNPFDLGRLTALADRHGLWLLEDCCDALGSTWNGRRVGTFGAMASLSFYPAHHMTMGEGGGVVINRSGLTRAAASIRDWGRDCFPAGTPVICRDGIRPIETVLAGHEVLTHEGRWRTVLELTGHRRYTRPMVTIRARLRPPITVSAMHPFWVRRRDRRQWIPAGDLRAGDELIARTRPNDGAAPADFAWSYRTRDKVYGLNAERFAAVIGERYTAKTPKRHATLDELTGEAFFPVVEVRPFAPAEPVDVYNLEVEDDHSYHAAGVAAHNCWCPPGESNTCGKRFDWQLGDLPAGYDHKYIYSNLGYNLKVTDMQAAVGLAQLDKLADFCAKRRANFRRLYEGLQPLADRLVLPRWLRDADPSWFAFPITVTDRVDRRALVRFLESRRIETRMIFAGNVLRQPGFRNIPHRVVGDLTVTDRVMTDTFFVGVYPGLTPAMLDWVVESFVAYFRR